MISRNMVLGSIVIVFAYIFWFSYMMVLQNDGFFYYPWIDIPLHISGGFILGLLFILLLRNYQSDLSFKNMIYHAVGYTMVIGGLWELYEGVFKTYENNDNLYLDTLSDLVNDLIGAGLAIGVVWFVYKLKERGK